MKDIQTFVPPNPLSTPVLFLVFNRLETSNKVFLAIKKAKPPKLYIAIDGPRKSVKDEDIVVKKVLDNITKNIDWECEVFSLIRENNLGCKIAISEAISWFFENEEQGIILEDDCLPSQSFFWFCEDLLNKYKNDLRIWHISGDNFQNGITRAEESYYFSKFAHVWGWATWKNRWECYDVMMNTYENFKKNKIIRSTSGKKKLRNYWSKVFELAANQKIDTWDYQWTYTININNGLSIIPEKNLVSNIGFGEHATHTKSTNSPSSIIKKYDLVLPLKHPIFILNNYDADEYTTNQKSSPLNFMKNKILQILEYIK